MNDVAVYTGEEGSLSHIAATQFFKSFKGTQLKGMETFADCFKEVSSGRALYAVIPVENSASGAIHSTYDLSLEHDVVYIGELGVREIYCLCVKGASKGYTSIKKLASHANILDSCTNFVKAKISKDDHGLDKRALRATTDAARWVSEGGADAPEGVAAAICTKEAAKRFGLTVIAEDIGNDTFIETRFILVHKRGSPAADRPVPFPRDVISPMKKRTGCFALRTEAAALYKLLSVWALRGIDVLKVETRPVPAADKAPKGLPPSTSRMWSYFFFVDYAVPAGQTPEADARLQAALAEFSLWHRDLGVYPSQISTFTKEAHSWEEMVDLMGKA